MDLKEYDVSAISDFKISDQVSALNYDDLILISRRSEEDEAIGYGTKVVEYQDLSVGIGDPILGELKGKLDKKADLTKLDNYLPTAKIKGFSDDKKNYKFGIKLDQDQFAYVQVPLSDYLADYSKKVPTELSIATTNNRIQEHEVIDHDTYITKRNKGELDISKIYCASNTQEMFFGGTQIAGDIVKKQFDILWPVGSIYIGMQSVCPFTLDDRFGKWTEVGQGMCLWGCDSSHNPGDQISAGMPYHSHNYNGAQKLPYPTGEADDPQQVQLIKIATPECQMLEALPDVATTLASTAWYQTDLSSTVTLSPANTVQPPALVVHMWKRTS